MKSGHNEWNKRANAEEVVPRNDCCDCRGQTYSEKRNAAWYENLSFSILICFVFIKNLLYFMLFQSLLKLTVYLEKIMHGLHIVKNCKTGLIFKTVSYSEYTGKQRKIHTIIFISTAVISSETIVAILSRNQPNSTYPTNTGPWHFSDTIIRKLNRNQS